MIVLAIVCLVLRDSLLANGYVSVSVQLMAVLLMVWARITFGRRSFHIGANPTEGGLVTTGPYKFIRHPIYASVLYFLWAGVFSHISFVNFVFGVISIAGVFMRILTEEHLLMLQYPEYSEYAARTKRIVPFFM